MLDSYALLKTTEIIPPEFLLDATLPNNDAYLVKLRRFEQIIVQQTQKLKPKHVQCVKRHLSGAKHNQIAQELKISPQTVSKAVNSREGQTLLELLKYYKNALEGANEAQRRNMLWRIATTNEETDPRMSIASISELNRMSNEQHTRKNPANGSGPAQQTTIIINQAQLPKTTLDG